MKRLFKLTVLFICLIIGTNLYNLHVQYENGKNEMEADSILESNPLSQIVYYENGCIKEIWEYDDNLENASFKKYYKNGNLYSQGQRVHGEYEGVILYYYEDGSLESEWEFVEGFAHGSYKAYHKNGNIKIEASRYDGTYHGVMTHYSEEGLLESRSIYEHGQVRKQTNFDLVSSR